MTLRLSFLTDNVRNQKKTRPKMMRSLARCSFRKKDFDVGLDLDLRYLQPQIERLDSYYKRNYKDYFGLLGGSLKGKEELSESEKGILDWLEKVTRSLRDISPADYIFKIESFSVLLGALEKYESKVFKAGGYEWKLSLYPGGNKNRDVKDHVSLYLQLANTTKIRGDWEANVKFTLFVFDHICDKYLAIEGR
ncbi:uncharacterized protein LOC132300106 isoform X2 [Cornus florida]|uniref:uncharacterized protein LOC132300106 isoform X2 n=1 Tax=Cornus florida TaxID=4283 RepID=UPI00289C8A39|nr:uncharacterized protein LOC132300106 isoform X2 [Cornus florida]